MFLLCLTHVLIPGFNTQLDLDPPDQAGIYFMFLVFFLFILNDLFVICDLIIYTKNKPSLIFVKMTSISDESDDVKGLFQNNNLGSFK